MSTEAFSPTTPISTPGQFLDPSFRDQMDARRSMWRRTPEAEYPDGYLGTIVDRRNDRLMQAIQKQLNRKVYDRGVHKGERIDQGDYYWPDGFESQGLRAVAEGRRQAPMMTTTERLILVNDGKAAVPSPEQMVQVDRLRAEQLQSMRPTWR